MKLSKKETLKAAKKFFQASFTNQELDLNKMRKNIKTAKTGFRSSTLSILRAYLNLLKTYLAKETLTLESIDKIDPKYIDEIKNHFGKIEGKSLRVKQVSNPTLLGGLRVSLGDTQWDYSTKGKIEKMKEALGGRYH